MRKNDIFIAILGLSAAIIFLAVLVLNALQKQDLQGRAYKSLGCDSDQHCPENTSCKGGVCVLKAPQVTQTPLSYISLSSIIETPTPIPAAYDVPTPTPSVNFLVAASEKINMTIVNIFSLLGYFLKRTLDKVF